MAEEVPPPPVFAGPPLFTGPGSDEPPEALYQASVLKLAGSKGREKQVDENEDSMPRKQVVFFIRHAQSRWNKAQQETDLVGMMSENDHGLSEEGRLQAEELRRRLMAARSNGDEHAMEQEWLRHLLEPDQVYSSPFTRAACTACIGLRDVLPQGRRLILLSSAREQKNFGGMDSTGVAVGEAIGERLEQDLTMLYQEVDPAARARVVEEFKDVELDTLNCQEAWWGSLLGDSEDHLQDRMDILVSSLRRTHGSLPSGGGATVVMGHSLYFREVFRRFLREPKDSNLLKVSRSLRVHVMPTCGVVGTVFEWDAEGQPFISEAVPLLGTLLKPAQEIQAGEVPTTTWQVQPRSEFSLAGCVCGRKASGECCLM